MLTRKIGEFCEISRNKSDGQWFRLALEPVGAVLEDFLNPRSGD